MSLNDEQAALHQALRKHFGVKARHVVWLGQPGQERVARVGVLHFRLLSGGHLQAWASPDWRDVRNLRELGYLLADSAALGTPPEVGEPDGEQGG